MIATFLFYSIAGLCFIFLIEATILGTAILFVSASDFIWSNKEKENELRREVSVSVLKFHLKYRTLSPILRGVLFLPFWLILPSVSFYYILKSIYKISVGKTS